MQVIQSGQAGDIKELTISIDGKNITTFICLVKIYQDIFIPCWSCQLYVEDSANILMQLPIKPRKSGYSHSFNRNSINF